MRDEAAPGPSCGALYIAKLVGNPRKRHHLIAGISELVVVERPSDAVNVQPRSPRPLPQIVKLILRFNQLFSLPRYQLNFGHFVLHV